jgi:aminomethyltransferase
MKNTPLTAWHQEHGAKMAEFGGYWMPISYQGILTEHEQVRTGVGMFDVSHMGEFSVWGPDAAQFLDRLVTHYPSQLAVGQVLYTPMCHPDGGTVDDLLIYRRGHDQFWLVVNAANRAKDWQWLYQHRLAGETVTLRDESDQTGLISVQGPLSASRLQPLVDQSLEAIGYYRFVLGHAVGRPAMISRTGYTGEDGFELYLDRDDVLPVWTALFDRGVLPVGLGARDTLRLEARMPLYGHELTDEISPLEAGLGAFVKWDKPEFIGKDALWRQKTQGVTRRLVGLAVDGAIARPGAPVLVDPEGKPVGWVTSGTFSPTLKRAIALALVPPAHKEVGQVVWVRVRARMARATVVPTPFYHRRRGSRTRS